MKTFRATLERGGGKLKWVIARIPFDAAKTWGKRGQIRVKGSINGFAFRASLFPAGGGKHMLLVNKRMLAGGRATLGTQAKFQLEADLEKSVAPFPPELQTVLSEDHDLSGWFAGLNHSIRKYIGDWIVEVKSPEARARRADQIAERLLATMEAERELPPLLRAAFAGDFKARQGWEKMSVSHRRGHLLAIFYYRDPESRARRIAKVLEDCWKFAERPARATRPGP